MTARRLGRMQHKLRGCRGNHPSRNEGRRLARQCLPFTNRHLEPQGRQMGVGRIVLPRLQSQQGDQPENDREGEQREGRQPRETPPK